MAAPTCENSTDVSLVCEQCGAASAPQALRRVERVHKTRVSRTSGGWSRPKAAGGVLAHEAAAGGAFMQTSPRYVFELKTPQVCEDCYQALSEAEAAEDNSHKRILTLILVAAAALGLAGLCIPGAVPAAVDLLSGRTEKPITVSYPPYKPPFAHVPSPPDPQ